MPPPTLVKLITSTNDFQAVIGGSHLTVVDFFATWCGPCVQAAPHIEEMAKANPNVVFIKVDVDQSEELTAEQGVQAMPTFMFFKEGKKLDSIEGADIPGIKGKIEEHKVESRATEIPDDATLQSMGGRQLLSLLAYHKVSTAGCVEKSELIELAVQVRKEHSGAEATVPSSVKTSETDSSLVESLTANGWSHLEDGDICCGPGSYYLKDGTITERHEGITTLGEAKKFVEQDTDEMNPIIIWQLNKSECLFFHRLKFMSQKLDGNTGETAGDFCRAVSGFGKAKGQRWGSPMFFRAEASKAGL